MSIDGVRQLETREGVRLESYKDSKGVWTIGVGHAYTYNGAPIGPGLKITQAQCDALFEQDIQKYELWVSNKVKVPLTQNQFDALVSFCFNIGTGGFASSSCLRYLNERRYKDAADAMLLWEKPTVLKKRREGERKQFLTTTITTTESTPSPVPSATPTVEGHSMFAGLITQQWHAILRGVLQLVGGALVAKGIVSNDQVASGTPLVLDAVGGLVSVGSFIWSIVSHKPVTIIKTAAKLRDTGH